MSQINEEINPQKAISLIQRQIDEIESIKKTDSNGVNEWKKITANFIEKIFGKESTELIDFKYIDIYSGDEVYRDQKLNQAKICLQNFIFIIKEVGILKEETIVIKHSGVTINNSNHQHQEIKIDFIINNLAEALNEKEKNFLIENLKKYNLGEITLKGLASSLKSFSGAVLQNILANIITNPLIMSSLVNLSP